MSNFVTVYKCPFKEECTEVYSISFLGNSCSRNRHCCMLTMDLNHENRPKTAEEFLKTTNHYSNHLIEDEKNYIEYCVNKFYKDLEGEKMSDKKKITFTIEADDFDSVDSIEVNFKDKNNYDHLTTKTTYDEEGRPVRIVSEYANEE